MKLNINVSKVIKVGAFALGVAATILTNISNKDDMKDIIAKEVKKQLEDNIV